MTNRYTLPVRHDRMTAIDLCLTEGENCGQPVSRSSLNNGAEALATWLLANAASKAVVAGEGPLMMGSAIRRLLCGAIGPSEMLADQIAQMSGGAVLPKLWELALPVDDVDWWAAATPPVLPETPVWFGYDPGSCVHYDPGSIDGNPSVDRPAVLGETPPGPLFGCVPPTRTCPYYEVHGLGLAFRLDPAGAGALYGALGDALARSGGLPVLEAAE
ncbi:hypothetical protein [Sphingomonas sp. KC8]|uniref:hypothetical protein n=1 Tax=Sphingomonas sp. KC8 TaxID=1030157 RepID=UPI000248939B|nr:hypothetical protein [Sphingomonas sp. KC8]ARS29058.1 hypothetical protein KC8_17450 [Sphingomonas sp. KC8]